MTHRFPVDASVMQRHQWIPALPAVVGLLILLQIPIWIGQWLSPAPIMVFSFELMFSALVLMRHAKVGWCLVMLCYLLEALRLAALNFHFVAPVDFLNAFRFAGLLDYRDYLSWSIWAALIGLTMMLAVVGGRLVRLCARLPLTAMWLVVSLIVVVDFGNGSSRLLGGGDRFGIPVNVAGSPLWSLVDSVVRSWRQPPGQLDPMPAESHETLRRWHISDPGRSQLVVLVESMGLPHSEAARQWLAARLMTPAVKSRWAMTIATDPFYGTTTYGELRVLCGLTGSYTKLNEQLGMGCLPAQWRRDGRATPGFHGFSLKMFDRTHWWPVVGLQPQALDARNERRCHATFAGVCDAPLIQHAVAAADAPGRFVYALTLDTHLPLPGDAAADRPNELTALCVSEAIADAACDLIWRTGRVLDVVAKQIGAMRTPAYVLVVGDHAPPFRARKAREAFDQGRVPLFLLAPR